MYNWSDYIAQAVIEEFEDETGIEVIYDVYDSNEVLEGKLLAGNTGYDIVGPSIEYLGRQIVAGIFQDLNKPQLTNYEHLDQEIMKLLSTMDPGNTFAIPYLWGTTGIGYDKNKAKEIMGHDFQMNTFDVIFNPEIIGKFAQCGVAFLDAPSEVFKAALFYLGLDPNTKDPKHYQGQAFDLLVGVRPFIRYFHSSKYINDLANGEICLVFGWNGDILQAGQRAKESGNNIDIDYQIPNQGAQMWVDMMAIPKDAPNSDNAHLFLNHILKPENIAKISNQVQFANPNKTSKIMLDQDILGNPGIYPNEEIMKKLFIAEIASPKVDRTMTRQWIKIKTDR